MKLDLHSIATTCMMVAVIVFTSCSDDEAINNPTIPEQPEQLTELTAQYNTNIAAYQAMMNGKAEIVDSRRCSVQWKNEDGIHWRSGSLFGYHPPGVHES